MKVAVYGCGPAGLLAAHAAFINGHQVYIYSRKVQSRLHGAQYLHEDIPDLILGRPRVITITKLGEGYGYAKKLYGDPFHATSWDRMKSGPHMGWSLQYTYEQLWAMYEGIIVDSGVPLGAGDPIRFLHDHDVVLNTVPLKFLCQNPAHEFSYVTEYVRTGELFLGERRLMPHEIIYSGRPEDQWHRASHLDGELSYEFAHMVPRGEKIVKPQSTTCDCYQETGRVIRLGRYGKWQRDELTTDAFHDAMKVLS